MTHKFKIGALVYFAAGFHSAAARGRYTVVRHLPIENDNRLTYRIKNVAESFERIADEHQLSLTE